MGVDHSSMPRLSTKTVTNSRRLRTNLTDAEKALWRHLRMRQMGGFRFRRQHPVRKYVVDFACIEARIAVEVDGGQHATQSAEDAQRSAILEREGYRVLQFWDNEVLQDVESVKAVIWSVLGEKKPPPP